VSPRRLPEMDPLTAEVIDAWSHGAQGYPDVLRELLIKPELKERHAYTPHAELMWQRARTAPVKYGMIYRDWAEPLSEHDARRKYAIGTQHVFMLASFSRSATAIKAEGFMVAGRRRLQLRGHEEITGIRAKIGPRYVGWDITNLVPEYFRHQQEVIVAGLFTVEGLRSMAEGSRIHIALRQESR
jgi:hypothetical protein